VDIYLFAGYWVWVLINYDNILKLVNYTIKICFNVIVRLINYFSIKEYLSGRISLLLISLFNDCHCILSLLECKKLFHDQRFHLRRCSDDAALCYILWDNRYCTVHLMTISFGICHRMYLKLVGSNPGKDCFYPCRLIFCFYSSISPRHWGTDNSRRRSCCCSVGIRTK
jgi:hypothetical protein